ncbi:uncharacterized protein [Porites lutea]|uniref:uncharacterized protein isoform X2 n=1 Tax=Porites lutea TaxID=51062 RepID=UPI003CC577C3
MKLMKVLCCNVFLLAYIATCYSQSQNIKPCALVPTRADCLKVHEVPRTPTPWVICGSGIKTTVEHLCGLRVKREGLHCGNSFLLSVAKGGEDGHGFKLGKDGRAKFFKF